ncbi:hypothetical protein D3C87_1639040 [compost metagenome]
MAMQCHRLVAEGLHFAAKAGFENFSVPVPDLRPDAGNGAAERAGMITAGDFDVTVVVDHHMVIAPHKHLRDGRIDNRIDLYSQMLRPFGNRSERGLRPVECADKFPRFASANRPMGGYDLIVHEFTETWE